MFFRFSDRQSPVFPYSIFIELLYGKVGWNEQETSKKRISTRHDHQQNLFSNRQPSCSRVVLALLSLPLLYDDMRCNGNVSYLYGPQKLQTSNTKSLTFAAGGGQLGDFSMKWLERQIKILIVQSITLPLTFREQSTTTILTLVARIITVGSRDAMIFYTKPCHFTATTTAKATNHHNKCTQGERCTGKEPYT